VSAVVDTSGDAEMLHQIYTEGNHSLKPQEINQLLILVDSIVNKNRNPENDLPDSSGGGFQENNQLYEASIIGTMTIVDEVVIGKYPEGIIIINNRDIINKDNSKKKRKHQIFQQTRSFSRRYCRTRRMQRPRTSRKLLGCSCSMSPLL
jgi:hypothetical protein